MLFRSINVANATWPPSFFISTLSFGVYLPVRLLSPLWNERRKQQRVEAEQQAPSVSTSSEQEQQRGLEGQTLARVEGSKR